MHGDHERYAFLQIDANQIKMQNFDTKCIELHIANQCSVIDRARKRDCFAVVAQERLDLSSRNRQMLIRLTVAI